MTEPVRLTYPGATVDTLLTTVRNSNLSATHKITRSATLVIAANNSSAKGKAQADYVCDGTEDNIEIQAALDALPATGGEIKLLDGNFVLAATVARAIDNVMISGNGTSTYLSNNDSTYIISVGSQAGWSIINLRVDAGGFDISNGIRWQISNVSRKCINSTKFVSISDWSKDNVGTPSENKREQITIKHPLVSHIDNFSTGWASTQGTVSVDSAIIHDGTSSLKLVTASGVTSNLEKTFASPIDFTDTGLAFWMYTPDYTKINTILVRIQSDGAWTTGYTQDANNFAAVPTCNGTWTLFVVPYFKEYVTPTPSNSTAIRIAVAPKAGESATVYFSDLMIWKNKVLLPTGAVTIMCDDGLASIYSLGKPKMDAYGFSGNLSIIIGRTTDELLSGYRQMHENGWDIINHSVDHVESRMIPESEYQYLIAKRWLQSNGFSRGADYCSVCFGVHDKKLLGIVDQHMNFGTSNMPGMNSLPVVPSLLRIRPLSTGVSLATLKTYIDDAKSRGCWLIILVHDIREAGAVSPQCLKSEFDEIIDYCASSGVEILTYSQVVDKLKNPTISNSGTGTITNGTTSVNIRHGFHKAPSSIQVTQTSSLGNAASLWVSSKDTGTGNLFTVSVNADPGADVTFEWVAVL